MTSGRLWIIQNRLVVAAEIAGKKHGHTLPVFGDDQFQAGGAEDVPGLVRAEKKFGTDAAFADSRNRLKPLQSGRGVLSRIERQGRFVFAVSVPRGVLGVFFHQVRGIGQQQRAEFPRSIVGKNRATVTSRHETRQVAAVVQVCMRQHHVIDRCRVHGERLPIP